MRQLFNAFADLTSKNVIYEWTFKNNDAEVDDVMRDVVFDVDFLKLSNVEVERNVDGGLQRSFCAFDGRRQK